MLTVILLAAGLSKRMGHVNKLRLPFGEKTILQATLQNIIKANLGEILVIVGHERDLIEHDLMMFEGNIKIVFNEDFKSGMTTSIQAGISNSDENTEGYMICLSDMPLLQSIDYQRISNFYFSFIEKKYSHYPIVQPVFNQQRGNPVIFHPSYKKELLNLKNTEGGKPVVQAHKEKVQLIEMLNDAILLDADTPEAYMNLVSHRVEERKKSLRK